jgi:RNA polymerase-binding transcription factor DksA
MAAARKAPAKKAPAKKAPAKRAVAQPAAKKSPARGASKSAVNRASDKHAAKKVPAQRAGAKPAAKKSRAAAVSKASTSKVSRSPAGKSPAGKSPAGKASKARATKVTVDAAPAKRRAADQAFDKTPTKRAIAKQASTKESRTTAKAAPAVKPPATTSVKRSTSNYGAPTVSFELPEPRGVSKDGIAYTKDFDVKFLKVQRDLLDEAKARLMGQAVRLEDEANSLIEEAEMGDVQFDDEGGEGDTMVVERERDLALSAQARQTIADIDEALGRLAKGTYGYSSASGRPIPRERLEAIPWATELVEEKVGGIGRR